MAQLVAIREDGAGLGRSRSRRASRHRGGLTGVVPAHLSQNVVAPTLWRGSRQLDAGRDGPNAAAPADLSHPAVAQRFRRSS
jgi:hypothetical protein